MGNRDRMRWRVGDLVSVYFFTNHSENLGLIVKQKSSYHLGDEQRLIDLFDILVDGEICRVNSDRISSVTE